MADSAAADLIGFAFLFSLPADIRLRRTRVKICGITNVDDALAAVAAGADAIGLVFYPGSPRAVTTLVAQAICAALPPFVTSVGLFVDAEPALIREILRVVPLDLLQFHGAESPEVCTQFERPYIKALRMRDDVELVQEAQRFRSASGLLLDTYRPGVAGGTGEVFDWQRIPPELRARIVLAGGLNPDNVGAAVAAIRPYAVDVSGGVEAAPGRKDARKIEEFIAAVDRADRQ
jgi:phosphoribosylanthranilate isomerase